MARQWAAPPPARRRRVGRPGREADARRLEAHGRDAGRGRAPSGLAHPAARHRLAGLRRKKASQREPEGNYGHVHRQPQVRCRLAGSPQRAAAGVGALGSRCPEGLLSADGKEVVHPGGEGCHEPLVDGAARGQPGSEGLGNLGGSDGARPTWTPMSVGGGPADGLTARLLWTRPSPNHLPPRSCRSRLSVPPVRAGLPHPARVARRVPASPTVTFGCVASRAARARRGAHPWRRARWCRSPG